MLYSLLEGISTDSLNEISFCANDSDLSQLKTAKSLVVEALSKVTAPAFIVVFLRYRCLNQSLNADPVGRKDEEANPSPFASERKSALRHPAGSKAAAVSPNKVAFD